jgi:hypothetical protein
MLVHDEDREAAAKAAAEHALTQPSPLDATFAERRLTEAALLRLPFHKVRTGC